MRLFISKDSNLSWKVSFSKAIFREHKSSLAVIDQLNNNMAEVRAARAKLETCLNKLEEADKDNSDAYEQKLEEGDKQVKTLILSLIHI